VLQSPGEGKVGHANGSPLKRCHEENATLGTIQNAINRCGKLCQLNRNPVLMELNEQEVDRGLPISLRCRMDDC
jgi:hypothetical protein